jgi:hypothetical protein
MSSLVTPLLKLWILKKYALPTPSKRFQNCNNIYIRNPPRFLFHVQFPNDSIEEFLSCCDIVSSPPNPRKVVQVIVKGEGFKRKKYLHNGPLNLQGEIHTMPNISMEKYLMFFGNTLIDAKKHLVKFEYILDNVVAYHFACRLFILTLKGNASEWFYSLLHRSITSWYVLENLFVEKYYHNLGSIFSFLEVG